MGVPKFYRWISERYPCLSEIVKENQIPEFDNLYLDMNGIIHTCSHPNDEDPHFRITEEQIFRDIFRYIEVLFRIIRPRKVFFMAVDGVAPRAKMNQQRGRRFMSARTAEELIEQAKKKGEKLPSAERFDSNCITPGTAFMAKLHDQLKYFVNMKITTDDMWQGVRIYLSGHDVPGEGEHKIMDFIRYERSQPGYDCNTRHCLYGLDADLIMLGLCSHEPYFALLREEVKFVRPSKKNSHRTSNAEQTTFHLLHLSLLRDYIELEFGAAKENLPFEFDLESIIDDWVLMGFLVGNDFIPHLPNLHIHANALPTLYKAYKKALPDLGGYINEKGYLNLPRFEKFMSTLAQFDRDFFEDEYEDLKWLESKASEVRFASRDIRKNVQRIIIGPKELVPYTDSEPEGAGAGSNGEGQAGRSTDRSEQLKERNASTDSDDLSQMPDELQDLIRRSNVGNKNSDTSGDDEEEEEVRNAAAEMKSPAPIVDYESGDDDDTWSPEMEKQFKLFKGEYYMNKMRFPSITSEVLHDQAVQYVRAIQWNLHYYYNGICSWSWYYPHHYAPYLSDVKGFSNLDVKFEIGEPFLPFQQLLAVLPAASKKLLPTAYQPLMTDTESPLIDFYPSKFDTDLNGKKNDWEAVILIPFIEEGRLLRAMTPRNASLTDEEKTRNRPGKQLLYTTAAQDQGFYRTSLMGVFPDIEHNKALCTELDPALFRLSPSKIRKGLLPGLRLDMYYLGFSTLRHLPYVSELSHHGVKVFEQPSKNESVIIKLLENPRCNEALPILAEHLLGKEVFINWPHLVIGLISAVSSESEKHVKDGDSVLRVALTGKESRTWRECAEEIQKKYAEHRAVHIGDVTVLVYIRRLIGRRYVCTQSGHVELEKQWGETQMPYALQTVVEDVKIFDAIASEKYKTLDDLYPIGSKVFLVSNPFYGCQGTVVKPFDPKNGRFGVEVTERVEPDFSRLIANQERIGLYWYPGWQAAQKLEVSGHFLGRITGTVYVSEAPPESSSGSNSSASANRFNIGLNLKFSKKNEEVPDYTKREADGVWLYSSKVLQILGEYIQKFPEVCDVLHTHEGGKDMFSAEEFWGPAKGKQKLAELVEWLKSLPSYGASHQPAGTESIDERVIRAIETAVEKNRAIHKKQQKFLGIRPVALFRSCLSEGSAPPDPRAAYQLFDRVVCAREGYTVPVGLRGTVVGLHPGRQDSDLKLSVIFDEEFIGGVNIRSSKCSGYHMMASALINLSFGARLAAEKESKEKEKRKQSRGEVPEQGSPLVPGQPLSMGHLYGHHPRKEETRVQGRRPVALQNAPPQPPAGHVSVVTKSAHSAFRIAQRGVATAGPSTSDQDGSRPTLHKSKSENIKVSYSAAAQGKSIMNEIFPNRTGGEAAKPGDRIFVNSNAKKKKDVEESSRALRELLHVGAAKDDGKKHPEPRGKTAKPREEQRQQTPQSTAKGFSEGPRVPFTARQPQPPPFEPDFSSADSPVVSVRPALPQPQAVAPSQMGTLLLPGAGTAAFQQQVQVPVQLIQSAPIPSTPMVQYQVQPHGVQPSTVPIRIVGPIPPMNLAQQVTHPPPTVSIPFNQIVLPNPAVAMGQQQHQQMQIQMQQFQKLQQIQQQQLQNLQAQYFQQRGQFPQMTSTMPGANQQHHQQQHQNHQLHHQQQQHQQQYQQHQAGQYQQRQFRDNNAQNLQGRQRKTSSGAGGHEQFVPLQVTKKQPAPAYVKNIAGKVGTETASAENQQTAVDKCVPNTVQRDSGESACGTEFRNKNQAPTDGSSLSRQKSSDGKASTRPKSRLAIKLNPTN